MLLLLVGMMQASGSLSRAVLPLVPLYLLAARGLAGSISLRPMAGSSGRWALACLLLAVPLLVGMGLLTRIGTPGMVEAPTLGTFPEAVSRLVLLQADKLSPQHVLALHLLLEAVLVVAAVVGMVSLLEGPGRRALGWWTVVLLGSGYLLHSSFFLNYRPESLPMELVLGTQVSPALREAAVDAEYFSDHFGAPVSVDPQLRPSLDWYLRGLRAVQGSTEATQGISLVLVQPGLDQSRPGSERRLGLYSPSVDPRDFTWQGVWRWMLSREGLVRPNQRDVIVRAPVGDW
jgi:hypothetical protein